MQTMHTLLYKPSHYYPSPAKVTQLQDPGLWVEEEVLWLDVAMTHPISMDVGQGPKQLVHVELYVCVFRPNILSLSPSSSSLLTFT